MKIQFTIDYRTSKGQAVYVLGSIKSLGAMSVRDAMKMEPASGEKWELELDLPATQSFSYRYLVKDEAGMEVLHEFGHNRTIELPDQFTQFHLKDWWRSKNHLENALYSSPFLKSFFHRNQPEPQVITYSETMSYVRMQIRAPRIGKEYQMAISGSCEALGRWSEDRLVFMSDEDFPVWKADFPVAQDDLPFEYKFVIYSHKEGRIVTWEEGENRYFPRFDLGDKKRLIVRTDEYFRYPVGNWKCAGVAIPVFSLRSEDGCGVGEFADIKKMVDWSVQTGLSMVQVLPVNDTVASHTWRDSYPYAAISVDALHPIYGNIDTIGQLKDQKAWSGIKQEAARLNSLEKVDYEAVMKLKSRFYKLSYDENKEKFLKSRAFKAFFKANEHWLIDYAAFSYFRDQYKTPDYSKWGRLSSISDQELRTFVAPNQKHYDDIAIHYYIQFHLDRQLAEATRYAREKGVVLKGDIPIGIYRYSVEAWRLPHLFNLDCQSGAPPDDFSVTGQNWGFPTYNWTEMEKDGYQWWKDRLVKMSEYFDVFRIDHILGFFRIWEIPMEAVEGLLGHFNPALPIHRTEFEHRGLHFDYDRWCKPYIRKQMIREIFGRESRDVTDKYFDAGKGDYLTFKSAFNTQRKLKTHFDQLVEKDAEKADDHNRTRDRLYSLHAEVLFLEVPGSNGELFNPRIDFQRTYSYADLGYFEQQQLDELYYHYFYHRHNEFWRDGAMEKLPVLKDATDMLICGEDLGMVPASVPGVMNELQILSLAIQRMPNDDREFWHPSDTSYLSVTSTGSHDMVTLREWWEEDPERSQRFYHQVLGRRGEAPLACEASLAKEIIYQHLQSPSMLAILPLQDLLAMDDRLKSDRPAEERINVPANPQHYWRYRMHISLEELTQSEGFNTFLRQLVDQGGRSADY